MVSSVRDRDGWEGLILELVDRSDILRLTYGLTGTISNINFLLQTTRVGQ